MFKFKKSPEKNEAEQELLNNRLKALQGSGDISKVNEPITLNSYNTLKDEYSKLTKKLTDTQSLVELNKSLAIIAVRADQDASTYLNGWKKNTSTNADDFMTGLQTILEDRIKFLQETGDITKIYTSLDSLKYESNKIIYNNLVKTIEKFLFSDAIKTKLSFDLNKCQAIIAVRAGKNEDALKYLLDMRTADMLSTDKFILELEPLAAKLSSEYTKTKKNEQSDSNEQPPKYLQLYHYLQTTVRTKVAAHLKNEKYTEAYDETQYLRENGNNLKVFKLYLSCIEQNKSLKSLQGKADAYIKAFNEFKLKISSSQIPEGSEIVADVYKCLQTTLQNISDKIVFTKNTENTKSADYILKNNCNSFAKDAKDLAEQYTPKQKQEEGQEKAQVSPTVTLTPAQQKAQKELEILEKEEVKLGTKLVNTQAKAATIRINTQFDTELEAATAKLRNELAAQKNQQLVQIEDEKTKQLEALHGSSKKDTPGSGSSNVVETSDSSKESAVETSDSSNVAETSDSSKESVSKGIYPSIRELKAELAADQIADAKASSSSNVYNSSPFSYTAETYKTVPITAVMPTLRTAVAVEDVVEDSVGANAPNTLVDTVINLLNSNDSNDKEVYKIFIESCKNLRATSEENYQLLKTIAEKTTDTDIQLAALTAAKSQTDNLKQQAELFLSKGKILLSLGKKEQASQEFGQAAAYNHDIYKDVAEETLKSLYESGNHEVGYWYLSKTHNFNHKDPIIANKLVEFSNYVSSVHGIPGEAGCFIRAYLCAPSADALVKVQNDLSIMASIPYAADYYKNYCAVRDTAQIETYLQGIVQVIDEHM